MGSKENISLVWRCLFRVGTGNGTNPDKGSESRVMVKSNCSVAVLRKRFIRFLDGDVLRSVEYSIKFLWSRFIYWFGTIPYRA
jgi:hypothetical protein